MQKRHVHTTLSLKHAKLLDKLEEKYGTKQKVLELALESLENTSTRNPPRSLANAFWMRVGEDIDTVGLINCGLIQKECYKFLLSTIDIERFKEIEEQLATIQYGIENIYQKPLKECTLKEVMDGVVVSAKVSGLMDTIAYLDKGDHYIIKLTHDMGLNNSKWLKIMFECLFRTYGVRAEVTYSERIIFINVFKNAI